MRTATIRPSSFLADRTDVEFGEDGATRVFCYATLAQALDRLRAWMTGSIRDFDGLF